MTDGTVESTATVHMQCPLEASSLVGSQYIHAMSARSILIGGILFSDEAEILAASHQPSCRLLNFMYTYFNVAPSEPHLHRRDPTLGIAFKLFRAPCLFPSQCWHGIWPGGFCGVWPKARARGRWLTAPIGLACPHQPRLPPC